jgi:hypothetical protein
MKRSIKRVLSIVAPVAAALGLVLAPNLSASASPSPNVAGTWTLIQSNQIRVVMNLTETPQSGHQVIVGTASFTPIVGDGAPVQGNLSGVLEGSQLTFTVAWAGDFEGVYIINAATAKKLNGYGYRAYASTDYATFTGVRS